MLILSIWIDSDWLHGQSLRNISDQHTPCVWVHQSRNHKYVCYIFLYSTVFHNYELHVPCQGASVHYPNHHLQVEDHSVYSCLNCNNNSNLSKEDTLVVDLSSHQLDASEIKVLKRGLKFCPTPGEPNFGDLREDLNKFHMRLRRQLFFSQLKEEEDEEDRRPPPSQNNDDQGFSHQKFREPSKWKPPPVTSLELFIRQNEMDLLTHKVPQIKFHNLPREEQLAIKSLSNNKSIVIKPADKGGAVVVQNVLEYINEGLRQLSDPKCYIETEEDPTAQHAQDINTFLRTMLDTDEIDDKCYEYLYVCKERTSLFYMLPKIHKK